MGRNPIAVFKCTSRNRDGNAFIGMQAAPKDQWPGQDSANNDDNNDRIPSCRKRVPHCDEPLGNCRGIDNNIGCTKSSNSHFLMPILFRFAVRETLDPFGIAVQSADHLWSVGSENMFHRFGLAHQDMGDDERSADRVGPSMALQARELRD
jgi:hypothetical protein